MKETSVNNPLVVRCPNCGGEVGFDIAKQRYCCAHCGSEFAAEEQQAEHRHWKALRHDRMMRDLSGVKSFVCPACGAQTLVAGDSVTAHCPFCQNTMIDAQFSGNDLPEVIIPFRLGKEEAEARLRAWLKKNHGKAVAKAIEKNMQNFTGCYLPYHIVRGTCNSRLEIRSNAAQSDYPFRAYLKHTAVNASSDLNNIFLDGIEPFDFSGALEFDFGYLNHQEAKVQNVDGEQLAQRIGEETQAELYKTFAKKVHTKELSVQFNDEGTESFPALLPVYLVKCEGGIAAAVNGQTGKVAIDTGKRKNLTKLWWMAPTAATLAVAAAGTWFGGAGLGVAGAFVFGILFFLFARSRHDDAMVQGIITWPRTKRQHNDTEAEFFADFGKGPVPAKIKFFTPWRIIKLVVAVLAVIFLPVLIAAPIQLLRGLPLSTIHIGYGAAWYCIPGFFTILAVGGLAKDLMYGRALYYEILPNGRTRRRRLPSQKTPSVKEIVAKTKGVKISGKEGCLAIGFVLFLLLGSTLAMIF